MARRIVAVLTDFGTGGPYVAAMKGAMLSVCAGIDLIDITHEVAPQDVAGGAAILQATVPYFPSGTVFLAVVDPGVGTSRRGVAAEAGGFLFVGPDNGVLAPILDQLGVETLVSIEEPRFARPTISPTFEGRDRFGPAAAWLAAGTSVAALGRPLSAYVGLDRRDAAASDGRLCGHVVWVDPFGNLVTNISRNVWLRECLGREGRVWLNSVCAGGLVRTYADADAGQSCALFGSTDQLEVAVRDGHAASRFAAGPGTPVEVVWIEPVC